MSDEHEGFKDALRPDITVSGVTQRGPLPANEAAATQAPNEREIGARRSDCCRQRDEVGTGFFCPHDLARQALAGEDTDA